MALRDALWIGLSIALAAGPGVARAQAETGTATESEAEIGAEAGTGTESEAETGAGTEAGTESEAETGAGTGTARAPSIVDDGEEALRAAESAVRHDAPSRWIRVRSRHDVVLSWAPRYRLEVAADPLGLEQQLWRRVEMLPLYHRVTAQGTFVVDEGTSLTVSFAGWGSLNLLEDAGGGLAAGDVAIGFVELDARPVSVWAGRRFLTYGPPGGLHVDGVGAGVRSDLGIHADAFVGRPVTPITTTLLGPRTDFEGAAIAYGARVGYSDPGTFSTSASYTELWNRGLLGSRTVDVAGTWDPGPLRFEAGIKLDVVNPGVVHARAGVAASVVRELALDADYVHVEPGRWIPSWSILSVFETSTYDELSAGATLRPARSLAIRAELAGRLYSNEVPGEVRLGYRADLSARVVPSPSGGPALRVLASRRDDGVIGYTVLQAGTALDLLRELALAIDGALAVDDAGSRLSTTMRASLDYTTLDREWTIGATGALAHTPFAEAEARAMLRLRWSPEVRR